MEDMGQSKEAQVSNIRETISNLNDDTVAIPRMVPLRSPGPTGGSAVIYLNGLHSKPVLLKQSVGNFSNNYVDEFG